jgi:O-antigen/teichoic acid export membrane protein
MAGTAFGQGAILLSTLYLARIYAPENFGVLAVLLTVTNIAAAVGCLRYDIALPAAAAEDVGGLVMTGAVTCVALGLLAGLAAASGLLPPQHTLSIIAQHPWMFASAITFAGLFQLATAWMLRNGAFALAGTIRACQGLIFPIAALLPGIGLLWAQVLSYSPGLLVVAIVLFRSPVKLSVAAQVARRNWRLPMLSLPGAALDVVGYSLLLWVVIAVYGEVDGGRYSQVQRLIGAPLMLLSIGLGQALLRHTAEVGDDLHAMRSLLLKTLAGMACLSAAAITVVAIAGQPLLRLVLGPAWRIDTGMAVAISIAISIRACTSPLSSGLITLRRFDIGLAWQALYFCSASLVFPFLAHRFVFETFIGFYAVHEVVLYSVYLALIFRARPKVRPS